MLPVYLLGGRWLIKCTQKQERRHHCKKCISLHVAPGSSWGKCKKRGLCARFRIGCACMPFLSCARWKNPPMTVQNIGGGFCLGGRWRSVLVAVVVCLSAFGCGRWLAFCGGAVACFHRLRYPITGGIFLYTIYIFRKY